MRKFVIFLTPLPVHRYTPHHITSDTYSYSQGCRANRSRFPSTAPGHAGPSQLGVQLLLHPVLSSRGQVESTTITASYDISSRPLFPCLCTRVLLGQERDQVLNTPCPIVTAGQTRKRALVPLSFSSITNSGPQLNIQTLVWIVTPFQHRRAQSIQDVWMTFVNGTREQTLITNPSTTYGSLSAIFSV